MSALRKIPGEKAETLEPEDVRPPEFSDDSLALKFAERHSSDLRYVAGWGRWLSWTGTHWKFDDTLETLDRARRICREVATGCENEKLARIVTSSKTVSAVVSLARADRRIAATIEQWDYDPWLLNTPSGVVDLRTGSCGPHEPSHYITKVAGIGPDPSCPIPIWNAFLDRVTGGDACLARFLQRMTGYALTGITREHALFFQYGTGANGKSTFLNTIINCIGDYHRTALIDTFTVTKGDRHPTELASLRGARLVTGTETTEGRRWDEAKIKLLTGGDRISARFMRQDPFEYTPQLKLIIAGNHKPSLRSVDDAIRRRFHLIPFSQTIPPAERDPELVDKLKGEWPGILQWAIDGCLDWQERGLAPPEVVTAATDAYLQAEDALTNWIEETTERDADAWETSTDLYSAWKTWAERAGEYPGTMKRFVQNLETRGVTPERKRNGRGFRGLKLCQPDSPHWTM